MPTNTDTFDNYRTKFLITSLTDRPVIDRGYDTKVIPVDSITGKLMSYDGYDTAILDVEGSGPVEVDTGICKFFRDEKAHLLAANAVSKGHKVIFEASLDDKITTMVTPEGQHRVALDTPKVPFALLTGKESAALLRYYGDRGATSDEKHAQDEKAVRAFLKMHPSIRKPDDLQKSLESGGVALEKPHAPKVAIPPKMDKSQGIGI